MKLLDVVLGKVLETINDALTKGKKRGFIPLRGLTEAEMTQLIKILKNLGLRAGVAEGGIWWAVPTRPQPQSK